MTINLQETMDRVAALQIEAMAALATPVTVDAKDFFYYVQGSYPYFVNRVGPFTSESDGEEFDRDTYDIIMRLVLGHLTQAYDGEPDNQLQLYIPHIKRYFNERELLQSAAYPTPLEHLVRARCSDGTGLQFFRHTGAVEGAFQVGTEWTLRCEFEEMIEQQYL